jgi:transcriptional regulator with XRE-family HTH domain
MGEGPYNLRQARLRHGWSQEQAIVRFESIARVLAVEVPARSSLRTLLSMFENNRRAVPGQYRPVFRELYRATDDELGISPSTAHASLPVPPALPTELPEHASSEILSYLSNVLAEHVKADAVMGPRYLVPAVQSPMPFRRAWSQLANFGWLSSLGHHPGY